MKQLFLPVLFLSITIVSSSFFSCNPGINVPEENGEKTEVNIPETEKPESENNSETNKIDPVTPSNNDLNNTNSTTTSIKYGRTDKKITSDGATREYIVHIPKSYSGDAPIPVVVMLHGTSGTGEKFWNISGWKEKGEKEGFISVYPTGLIYCVEKDGKKQTTTKWLSPQKIAELCPGQKTHDDLRFMNDMLDQLEQNYNIDKSRIYFSGFSNGGGFVRSVVFPEMSARVAAGTSMGGLTTEEIDVKGRIMPLFTMLGEVDDRVAENRNGQPLPMKAKAFVNDPVMSQLVDLMLKSMDLKKKYQAVEKQKYLLMVFTDELSGPDTVWKLSVIKGLQHRYPNGKNNPAKAIAANIFWRFLSGSYIIILWNSDSNR